MDSYGGPERRKYQRYECKFWVSYKAKETESGYDYSHTKNLSRGGMLLLASEPFERGAQLQMILRIPYQPDTLTLEGQVRWRRQIASSSVYELGIEFSQFDTVLDRFIDERLD